MSWLIARELKKVRERERKEITTTRFEFLFFLFCVQDQKLNIVGDGEIYKKKSSAMLSVSAWRRLVTSNLFLFFFWGCKHSNVKDPFAVCADALVTLLFSVSAQHNMQRRRLFINVATFIWFRKVTSRSVYWPLPRDDRSNRITKEVDGVTWAA